jgi:hypothetical protein
LANHRGRLTRGVLREAALVTELVFYYLAMLAIPIGCGEKAVSVGQDINFDSLNYHVYDAWAFLQGRTFTDVFPAGAQSLVDPLINVPTYLLQAHASPHVASFVIGFEQGLGPVLAMVIVQRMTRSPLLGILAGITATISGGFASELGNDMGDSMLAPVFLLAVLFALNAIRARHTETSTAADPPKPRGRWWRRQVKREYRWWLASGLVAGLGGGLKFAELPIAVGVVAASVVVTGPVGRRAQRLLVSGLGGIIGVALTAGQWTIELWQHYGDPFAFLGGPLLGFSDPYFAPPTPSGASAVEPLPIRAIQMLWSPVTAFFHPLEFSELPVREASLAAATAMVFALAIVAVGVLAVRLPHRRRASRQSLPTSPATTDGAVATDFDWFVVTVLVVSVLLWSDFLRIYRYLIPLEVLAPVLLVATSRRIIGFVRLPRARRLLQARALPIFFVAICIVSILTAQTSDYWDRGPFNSTWSSITTPKMLQNGKTNILVGLSAIGYPSAFILPLLKAKFIAVGGITGQSENDMLTPSTYKLLDSTFEKVRKDGGSVFGYWRDDPSPEGPTNLINALDPFRERMGACVSGYMTVAAYLQLVTFCRFVPVAAKHSSSNGTKTQ